MHYKTIGILYITWILIYIIYKILKKEAPNEKEL